MKEALNINWETYKKDAQMLFEKLDRPVKGKIARFNKIACITRGGLMLTDYLARKLSIRYIETVCIYSYTDKNQKTSLKVVPESKPIDERKGWLIVDDLIDSGETLKEVKKLYPNAKVAVLYKKPYSPEGVADYVSRDVEDVWIKFPWE